MEQNDFWNEIQNYYPELIQIITDMSEKTYVSVTDVSTRQTWWSEKAMEFFGLTENMAQVGREKTKITIHPADKEGYIQAVQNRMNGIDLDIPFEYRVQTRNGHYDRFTASSRVIRGNDGKIRFLIIHYENHGIADEVDSVTGLHTEPTLRRDLEDYIHRRIPAVILKIGMVQFSRINVLYGAEYADSILNVVSQELVAHKTERGFAYRMQGAKFAIVFSEISDEELRGIYERIQNVLANEIVIEGRRVPLKIVGGAVHIEPGMKDTNTVRSYLTYALNRSRYHRHGELVIFNEEYCGNNVNRLDLVSVIHQDAVDKKEGFFLCYQPIVDCNSGKIKGMEALLRWKKEPYGVVPPNVFIDWLEEDACIYELGNWIIQTALAACKRIAVKNPDFFVNVNVCPAQLERHEFRQKVLSLLAEAGFAPNQLCLELTERCRNLDVSFLKGEVEFFRSKGIKIALDDFGTGTSSLSMVLDLPIDEVKIDMSFIKGIQEKPLNQAMIQAIIEFSDRMQLETCIEGVENREICNHLLRYGAKWFQGYYYSKPVTIDEFEKLLINKE